MFVYRFTVYIVFPINTLEITMVCVAKSYLLHCRLNVEKIGCITKSQKLPEKK